MRIEILVVWVAGLQVYRRRLEQTTPKARGSYYSYYYIIRCDNYTL